MTPSDRAILPAKLPRMFLLCALLVTLLATACGDRGDTPMDWSDLDRQSPAAAQTGANGEGMPPVSEAEIILQHIKIAPQRVVLFAGGTVTFTNLDPVPHAMAAGSPEEPGTEFRTDLLGQTDSFALTLGDPGIYNYYCTTHANVMRDAVIEVVDQDDDPKP